MFNGTSLNTSMPEQPTRFTAKRDGAHGALIKDNLTGRTVAKFPTDPKFPAMARKFADVAVKEFNKRHQQKLEHKKNRGW
ncbi:MAG: hypothetical protein BA863_04705 [Desulfovibrio sp. S3730MH75]|nr:MAG: hypothetical protein BA863_04705 [Desulfovibrio sp. S3730MH75]